MYEIDYEHRLKMPNWTPDHSMILSLLLDVVVGTKEEIAIRQDYCRLLDSLKSTESQHNVYFTGSKSEGLALPGSDLDYMHDINYKHNMKVIQSLDECPTISNNNVIFFLMCTENVPPGFALLHYVPNVHQTPIKKCVYKAIQNINHKLYLSSDVFIDEHSVYITDSNYRYMEKYSKERAHHLNFGVYLMTNLVQELTVYHPFIVTFGQMKL